MRLVYAADGETAVHLFVHAAAGVLILVVEGAAVLVHHHAVVAQRLIAAAVKFLGEQPLRRAERIGGVVDNQIVLPRLPAQKAKPVLRKDAHARIIQSFRRFGEKLAADLDEHFVRFDDVDLLDFWVVAQFLGDAAVAAADDEHLFHVRVHRHGDVDDHFVVDELVLFGEYNLPVKADKPPQIDGVEHVHLLVVALPAEQLLRHADREFYVGGMYIGKPHFHSRFSLNQNVEPLYVDIFRALHGAALFLRVENIIDDFLGDALARREDGNPRRIAHDEFRADVPLRFAQRQRFFIRIKRGFGRKHDLRRDVFVGEHPRLVLAVQPLDVGKRADEPLDILDAVADGDVRQNVADIAEFDLNIVLVAQDIVDLDSRQPDVAGVDGKFGDIEIVDARAVDELLAVGVIASDVVDFVARVLRHFHNLFKGIVPVQCKIAAADIQARHQKIGRARRLHQVDDLAHIIGIHPLIQEEQRALREASARFVHGDGRHIRPRLHGADGQFFMKIEMRAVRFVRQNFQPVRMCEFHDGAQVRTYPVISGVVDKDRHRLGVGSDSLFQTGQFHAERNPKPLVDFGIDVHGNGAAQNQAVDDALVHVARQNDFVPFFADGENHALHRGCRAADHKEGILCAERLRGERFRLLDYGGWVAEVVQRLHRVYVQPHAFFAQQGDELGVAPTALMAGHVKGNDALPAQAFQCFV